MTTILSIQSATAYGHAGNSAATFPLMRLGCEVWPVYTVNFSNNTSYGSWRGPVIPAADVAQVVSGIEDRGVLDRVDGVLSGYLGSPEIGGVVTDAVAKVRAANPATVYCCDPVMGDVGRGFFVAPGIPEFLRDHVVPHADIVTPNQFELEFLTGRSTTTFDDLFAAADALRASGPRLVLVTSAVLQGAVPNTVTMVAVSAEESWSVTTPLLNRTFTGSGDLTAAMFLAHYLRLGDVADALAATAGVLYSVLKATDDAGERELALVRAQREIPHPSHRFEAVRVR